MTAHHRPQDGGQESQTGNASQQHRGAGLSLHQPFQQQGHHARQKVIGNEQQKNRDQPQPEGCGAGDVQPHHQPQLERQNQKPERVEYADEVPGRAPLLGFERIAAQLGFREDGIHAEAQNHGGHRSLHVQAREHRLRYDFGLAAAHRQQRGAESSRSHHRDQQHQQKIAGHEKRDPAVSRARLGPQQFVA